MPLKPPAIEHKTFDCEFKSGGDDGSFELYALAFNNVDRVGDIIVPGAVSNVDELVKDGCGLIGHAMSSLPVAYAESAVQDDKGLLVRGKFHGTAEAQACRTVVTERMAAGKSVKCSIGYAVDDASYETRGGEPVRLLKSIRVYEFSFVNVPANPSAGVVSAKSLESEEDPLDEAEKSLLALLIERRGMETKKGKAISKANRETMAALAGRMAEHHSELGEQLKSLREQHKALCATHKEFHDFVKSFEPPGDGDGDEDDDGDEGQGEEPRREKPAAKSIEPPDRHAVAAALAALSLPD